MQPVDRSHALGQILGVGNRNQCDLFFTVEFHQQIANGRSTPGPKQSNDAAITVDKRPKPKKKSTAKKSASKQKVKSKSGAK